MPSVVLITGVSRFLGGRLAAHLAADPSVERVIGVDTVPPSTADLPLLGRTEFVRADIRNPLIATVIAQAEVSTVVHAGLMAAGDWPATLGGRAAGQEMNVTGTMQLLGACQKSASVRRVVLRSTTSVYGCGPANPAVFTEDSDPDDPAVGYAKDAAEVEGFVRGFARRRPDVATTILRLAPTVGPNIGNAVSRYLSAPVVPTMAGFDPRLQLLHETDAVEVLRRAVAAGPDPGLDTVNVAADGVVTLSQLVRRAGRVRLPVPPALFATTAVAVRNAGAADVLTDGPGLLRYGRVVDTRRLLARFGYRPRYSALDAIATLPDGGLPLPRAALGLAGVGSDLLATRRTRRAFTDGLVVGRV